jgi:hypothetical protein
LARQGRAWLGESRHGAALKKKTGNKMKTIEYKMTGTTPFLFNKFKIENVSNKNKAKHGSAGNDPEEWKEKIWAEGVKLFVPAYYVFGSVSEGAHYVKEGKGSIKKKLMGCLLVKGEKFYLNYELPKAIEKIETEDLTRDSSKDVYLDIRAVKNPMTKGKNVRYRLGMRPGWFLHVMLEWDDTILSKDNIKNAIEHAGKFVGIGDGRLLGHGRYICEDVKIF